MGADADRRSRRASACHVCPRRTAGEGQSSRTQACHVPAGQPHEEAPGCAAPLHGAPSHRLTAAAPRQAQHGRNLGGRRGGGGGHPSLPYDAISRFCPRCCDSRSRVLSRQSSKHSCSRSGAATAGLEGLQQAVQHATMRIAARALAWHARPAAGRTLRIAASACAAHGALPWLAAPSPAALAIPFAGLNLELANRLQAAPVLPSARCGQQGPSPQSQRAPPGYAWGAPTCVPAKQVEMVKMAGVSSRMIPRMGASGMMVG